MNGTHTRYFHIIICSFFTNVSATDPYKIEWTINFLTFYIHFSLHSLFQQSCYFWRFKNSKRSRFSLNGMLRHSLGGVLIFISLQHFIAPALDLLPYVQAQRTRDYNKGSKFKKGAIKYCLETKITAPHKVYSFVDPMGI